MVVLKDEWEGKAVNEAHIVHSDEYFLLEEEVYQFIGVDEIKGVAAIRRLDATDLIRSPQAGFVPPFFSEKDYVTGREVSIDDYRGKHVLLDLMSTSCGPCIMEFPRLKRLMSTYGPDKFAVIGIIGNSKEDHMIEIHNLFWPQVLSNDVVRLYKVLGYPTTYIISPEGKVIYKNVKGEELEKLLAEIIK